MLPALVLVGAGKSRRVWIPIPSLLLWPLWLLGWAVWLVLRVFQFRGANTLYQALLLCTHLSGVRVDVDSGGGERLHIRMI